LKRIITKKVRLVAALLVIVMMGIVVLPALKAEAAANTNGYLILVEEKDGLWSSYENYVEVKSEDKLMVKAYALAKAVGIRYKKIDANNFTISNSKKVNTYTKGTTKYKYNNGAKSITKKAAYKPYTSAVYNTNLVEYNSLATLINVKYYNESKAINYKAAGYKGVICFSKYHKITELPTLQEGVRVTTEEELREAAADLDVSIINVADDISIMEDFSYEREDNAVTVNIMKGKTLTINKTFLGVGGTIHNDGIIIVKGSFERGICELINNGSVVIADGGSSQSGMSDLNNNGSFTVADGASLYIDRGSIFYNSAELINEGMIRIDNGGSISDKGGMITNNGVIDLFSHFNGDISLISGTGTINDYRDTAGE